MIKLFTHYAGALMLGVIGFILGIVRAAMVPPRRAYAISEATRLSEHSATSILETADIGGANAATGWVSMEDFERVYAEIELGTFNDSVTTLAIQQADTSGGGNAKTLAGGTPTVTLDTDGQRAVVEARAQDLDVANGFKWVRLYVAATGNTGVDNVTGFLMRHNAAHSYAQRGGAADYAAA